MHETAIFPFPLLSLTSPSRNAYDTDDLLLTEKIISFFQGGGQFCSCLY